MVLELILGSTEFTVNGDDGLHNFDKMLPLVLILQLGPFGLVRTKHKIQMCKKISKSTTPNYWKCCVIHYREDTISANNNKGIVTKSIPSEIES